MARRGSRLRGGRCSQGNALALAQKQRMYVGNNCGDFGFANVYQSHNERRDEQVRHPPDARQRLAIGDA